MPQPHDDPAQRPSPTAAMLRSLSLASSRGLGRTTTLGEQNADATQARLDAAADEPDPTPATPGATPAATPAAAAAADAPAPPDPARLPPLPTPQPSTRLEHELRFTGARPQPGGGTHGMYARLGATFVVWVAWATVLVTMVLQADVAEDNVLFAIVAVSAAATIASLFIWIGDMRRAGMRRARLRRREHRRLHRDDESQGTTSAR